jgi:hypothetical protein
VEAWVNQVQALYRVRKLLSFDLDSLCINVLLNGLPDRFASFVDSICKAEENPSIEDIKIEIIRVNAGQLNRSNDRAVASRAASLSLNSSADTSFKAFYAGLEQSGTKPSKEHPCARCGSPTLWVVDCPKSMESSENWKTKKLGKSDQPSERATPVQYKQTERNSGLCLGCDHLVRHQLSRTPLNQRLPPRPCRWLRPLDH